MASKFISAIKVAKKKAKKAGSKNWRKYLKGKDIAKQFGASLLSFAAAVSGVSILVTAVCVLGLFLLIKQMKKAGRSKCIYKTSTALFMPICHGPRRNQSPSRSRAGTKECVLFLWVTFPQLKAAFEVIKAGGFSTKPSLFYGSSRQLLPIDGFLIWDIGQGVTCHALNYLQERICRDRMHGDTK